MLISYSAFQIINNQYLKIKTLLLKIKYYNISSQNETKKNCDSNYTNQGGVYKIEI